MIRVSPRGFVAIWVALFAAVVLACIGDPAVGFGYALSWLFLVTVIWQYKSPGGLRNVADSSDPLFLAGIVVLVSFGVRSMALITGIVQDPGRGIVDPAMTSKLGSTWNTHYVVGLAFGFACWLSLLIGYHLGARRPTAPTQPTSSFRYLPPTRKVAIVCMLAAIGWSARLILLSTNPGHLDPTREVSVTPLVTLANALTTLCTAAIVVGLLGLGRERGGFLARNLVIMLIVLDVFHAWATNNRTQLVSMAIVYLSYRGLRGAIKIRTWQMLSVPVLILLIGATTLYRLAPSTDVGLGAKTQFVVDEIEQRGSYALFEFGFASIVSRYQGVDSVAAVIALPKMPIPRWGSIYGILALSPFIPRVLWPSKPMYQVGNMFSIQYFNKTVETAGPTIPTWFGDLAIQFPLPTVPVITFCIGIALRRLRDRVIKEGSSVTFTTVFYLLAITQLVTMDGWLPIYKLMLSFLATCVALIMVHIASRTDRSVSLSHAVKHFDPVTPALVTPSMIPFVRGNNRS